MYVHVLSCLLLCCIFEGSKKNDQKRKLRYTLLGLAVGSEQKLYFCYDYSDPVYDSIKTIVIEQVRRDTSPVKQAYVNLTCNVWLFFFQSFTMLLRMLV